MIRGKKQPVQPDPSVENLETARMILARAEKVLQQADKYFQAKDQMDAASYYSEVDQTPLHAEIVSVLEGIGSFKS